MEHLTQGVLLLFCFVTILLFSNNAAWFRSKCTSPFFAVRAGTLHFLSYKGLHQLNSNTHFKSCVFKFMQWDPIDLGLHHHLCHL